jgi:hypothetical protein
MSLEPSSSKMIAMTFRQKRMLIEAQKNAEVSEDLEWSESYSFHDHDNFDDIDDSSITVASTTASVSIVAETQTTVDIEEGLIICQDNKSGKAIEEENVNDGVHPDEAHRIQTDRRDHQPSFHSFCCVIAVVLINSISIAILTFLVASRLASLDD